MKSFVAVPWILFWAAHATAQDVTCTAKKEPFVNGGTTSAVMLMINDGKPCQLRFRFGGEHAPDSWELVSKPQAGTVQFRDDAAEYQPNPGFTGTDKFTVAVFGRSTGVKKRDARNGKFDVSVTVNPKP